MHFVNFPDQKKDLERINAQSEKLFEDISKADKQAKRQERIERNIDNFVITVIGALIAGVILKLIL